MNEDINPELIEKAAKALADDWNPERDPILSAMFRDYAQTALCAVLPYVIRQANPYRSERNESPDENPVLVAMAEYGEAIRGDWSDFDGSSEQGVIDGWVQELRQPDPSHDSERRTCSAPALTGSSTTVAARIRSVRVGRSAAACSRPTMPKPILCHECGHDIDEHRWDGCFHEEAVHVNCLDECNLSSTDVARAYADKRVREAMDSHRCDEQAERAYRRAVTAEADARKLDSVRAEVAAEAARARQAHRSCRVDHFAHDYCRWVGMGEAYHNVLSILDRKDDE